MEGIEYTINKLNIHNVALRIQKSLDETKRRQPNNKNLHRKMNDCYEQLFEAYIYFTELEPIIRGQEKRNLDLETINLSLKAENNELKNKIKNLLENATL